VTSPAPLSAGVVIDMQIALTDMAYRAKEVLACVSGLIRRARAAGVCERRGAERLVVTGMQTEYCVDTTCRRAISPGLRRDACRRRPHDP